MGGEGGREGGQWAEHQLVGAKGGREGRQWAEHHLVSVTLCVTLMMKTAAQAPTF